MITVKKLRNHAIGSGLAVAVVLVDSMLPVGLVIKNVEARFGRPATPVSVAGVARRTTRRTIRRSTVYASTLPRGCTTVVVNGTSLHQCGTTYYQTQGSQYVVVFVD
jgi:hypothetical protein